MGSVRDRLKEAAGTRCTICSYLSTLSASERAEWQDALAEPANVISHISVARVLIDSNVPITEASVRRHRAYHVGVR